MNRRGFRLLPIVTFAGGLALLTMQSAPVITARAKFYPPSKCLGNPCRDHEICCYVGCPPQDTCISKDSGQGTCPPPSPCPDPPFQSPGE